MSQISVSLYRGLFELLEEAGHCRDDIFRELSIPEPASLEDYLPADAPDKLWRLGHDYYGPMVGAMAGQRIKSLDSREIGVFLTTVSHVADWAEQLSRYGRLLSDVVETNVIVDKSGIALQFHYREPVPYIHEREEFTCMWVWTLMGHYLEQPVPLSRLELRRAKPMKSYLWEEAFDTKIVWGSDVCRGYIAHDYAFRTILTKNPHVRRAFQVTLNNRLRGHDRNNPLAAVRAEIVKQLGDAAPSLESIAKAMNISNRTLQRQLKEANQTFTSLLGETRLGLARHYLQLGVPVKEVAHLARYTGLPAFYRAFKRQTGQTPQKYSETKSD